MFTGVYCNENQQQTSADIESLVGETLYTQYTWLVDRRQGSLRTSFRNGDSMLRYLETT